LNGKNVAQINLPKDFELAVVKSKEKVRDKTWSFTNYSNGKVFQGWEPANGDWNVIGHYSVCEHANSISIRA
jgi:hypothetical protein